MMGWILIVLFLVGLVFLLKGNIESPAKATDARLEENTLTTRLNGYHSNTLRKYLNEGDVVSVWCNENDFPQVRVYIRNVPDEWEHDRCISVLRSVDVYNWAYYRSPKGLKHYYSLVTVSKEAIVVKRIEEMNSGYLSYDDRRRELLEKLKSKPKYKSGFIVMKTTLDFNIAPNRDNKHLSLELSPNSSHEDLVHKYFNILTENEARDDFNFENRLGHSSPKFKPPIEATFDDFHILYKGRKCNVCGVRFLDFERFIRLHKHFKVAQIVVRDRAYDWYKGDFKIDEIEKDVAFGISFLVE